MTTVVMDITRIEALHLRNLVAQFVDLLDQGDGQDPALARLTPDAYPDDVEASREFRGLTRADLLRRRTDDAGALLADLAAAGDVTDPASLDPEDALTEIVIVLDADRSAAWLRTLAALRLVLASRLGVVVEDDRPADDPRFGIYDWLGYRLDGLVRAVDEAVDGSAAS
ncbi:MAG: DUF2017 family protein [Microbacterium sp.]|uniref:DUF2017 family protein n=1 Tax=Microbacterium sp. TaxID=51671 RepID=UPI0039E653E2